MKKLDQKKLLMTWLLVGILGIGLSSQNVHANPIVGVLSLIFAEKVSDAGDDSPATEGENILPAWRKALSDAELAALNDIQIHPAVDTCMEMADQNHPIASYNARKIAEFSAYVKLRVAKTGRTPAIESIRYQWPARAFRWCSKKAGITMAGKTRNLEELAYGMIRVVQSIENQQHIIVMRDNPGQIAK
jgi:hypothetical protein